VVGREVAVVAAGWVSLAQVAAVVVELAEDWVVGQRAGLEACQVVAVRGAAREVGAAAAARCMAAVVVRVVQGSEEVARGLVVMAVRGLGAGEGVRGLGGWGVRVEGDLEVVKGARAMAAWAVEVVMGVAGLAALRVAVVGMVAGPSQSPGVSPPHQLLARTQWSRHS
jgi:hypothetical protein